MCKNLIFYNIQKLPQITSRIWKNNSFDIISDVSVLCRRDEYLIKLACQPAPAHENLFLPAVHKAVDTKKTVSSS